MDFIRHIVIKHLKTKKKLLDGDKIYQMKVCSLNCFSLEVLDLKTPRGNLLLQHS